MPKLDAFSCCDRQSLVTDMLASEGDRLCKRQKIAQVDDKPAAIQLKIGQATLKKLCLDL